MGVISVLRIAKNDENKAFRHLSIYSILMRERKKEKLLDSNCVELEKKFVSQLQKS